MTYRGLVSPSVLAAVMLALSLAPPPVSGQTGTAGAATAETPAPRTPWGHPDLQGAWTNATITPLERPEELGDREYFTEEEVAARDRASATRNDQRGERGTVADIGSYNAFWWERGATLPSRRTSLIVDPPNGRMPSRTPEAQRRAEEERRARAAIPRGAPIASWKDMDEYDRCIIRATLPRVPTGYNNNYQIVQTPQYVAILQEQMHEVRIIPLDGRPHLPKTVPQWLGDSRGRWDGETLVVETTNLSSEARFEGSGAARHLVERFRRIDADTIEYEFTVTDPTVWTRPFTARWPWKKIDALYEYACHEGNYSIVNMLSGSRADEKRAADEAAAKAQSRR